MSSFILFSELLTCSLWEGEASLELDPEPVIHLLYSVEDVDNDAALCA